MAIQIDKIIYVTLQLFNGNIMKVVSVQAVMQHQTRTCLQPHAEIFIRNACAKKKKKKFSQRGRETPIMQQ